MANISRPRVFVDVNIHTEPVGRITIELFVDKTPKTCENFRQLCTGEHDGLTYEQTPFHRVIDEFMIQGGDIANGNGTGLSSIYGGEFEDENLEWRDMDASGLVCAANNGKDRNSSQFFITLEPCPHLNGRNTIFGRVVSGVDTLKKIASVATDRDDRPIEPVLIARCGELEKRKKPAGTAASTTPATRTSRSEHHPSEDSSAARGRRRKSDDSDAEMRDPDHTALAPPAAHQRRRRRQSDNIVDEGIRGRPRLRSGSQSPSSPRAIDEDSEGGGSRNRSPRESMEGSETRAPSEIHKRKRSPSPSRPVDRRRGRRDGESREGGGEDDPDEVDRRRRRSLPNQYHDRYRPGRYRRGEYGAAVKGGRERDDRYRPERDRGGRSDDGRLGGAGGDDGYVGMAPAVKFKGRGVMKYRETDRAW